MNFTPGPWSVGEFYDDGHDRYTSVHAMRSISIRTEVAAVWPQHFYGGEMEANARLIARAPQMYEALKALLDDDECQWDYHGYCQTHLLGFDRANYCPMQQARAAIEGIEE